MPDLKDPTTFFAAERTLLAWNRTSLALTGFGFLVERSGVLVSAIPQSQMRSVSEAVTLWIGLAFIALGIFAAFASSHQYVAVLANLDYRSIPKGYRPRLTLALNGIVGLLGAVLGLALFIGRS